MRTSSLTWILILTDIRLAVCVEVVYHRWAEGRSVELSCTPGPEPTGGAPTALTLGFSTGRRLTEVLTVTAAGEVRVGPAYQGRVEVTGGLDPSSHLNVTISQLRRSDTGLYVCGFAYAAAAEPSNRRAVSNGQDVFHFLAGAECESSSYHGYQALLYAVSAATLALLLALLGLGAMRRTKARRGQKPQPAAQETTGEQQRDGSPRNRPVYGGPSHLEETGPAVCPPTEVKQSQNQNQNQNQSQSQNQNQNQNHYASPRQARLGV